MRRATFLMLILPLVTVADATGAASLEGEWVGGAALGRASVAIAARFSGAADSLRGEARLDTKDGASFRELSVERSRFRGRVGAADTVLVLDGTLQGDAIRGRSWRGVDSGTFELHRLATLDSTARRTVEGVYRLPNGDLISISSGGGRPGALYFDEGEHDRSGELLPLSPTEFAVGPASELCYPFTIRATLQVDSAGVARALVWRFPDQPQRTADRVLVREEEVRVRSNDVDLAGTLVMPRTPGPWAAIVCIGGSGPATRDQFGAFPHRLAAQGLACLVYDKRGSGQSGGQFHDFIPIEELARDAIAAVTYLAARADIDSSRIGLFAVSQGGWVAPVVASRGNVAFIALKSAPTVSVAENSVFEMENDLRLAGHGAEDIAHARALTQQFHRIVLSGGHQGWDSLRVALTEAERQPWFNDAGLPSQLPEVPAAANLRWVARVQGYLEFDPALLWRGIRVPVLALYGGLDRNLPADLCARLLREGLAEAGNRDVEVRLYPSGDHQLWAVAGPGPTELHRARVQGLSRTLEGWIIRTATRSNARGGSARP